jgi:alpha/beta superfamily hydrolase
MDEGLIREAAYAKDGRWPFFAWHHADSQAAATGMVAVVCPPIGSEYTRSHRSLRHLADRLARAGIPALRFDYHGTGDSPGTDLDPGRVQAWLANIQEACALAKARSGCTRVCLVGVRLGATLAAIASAAVAPDLLVLWNAPVKGRPYVRELQAIAMTAARAADGDGALVAAGYIVTSETLAALRRIDLLQAPVTAGRVLIVARDDLARDDSLDARLTELGIPTDTVEAPGWNGMMADHQHTVVPEAALETIVDWVRRNAPAAQGATVLAPARIDDVLPLEFSDGDGDGDGEAGRVEEVLCRFGDGGRLFGVLARPDAAPNRPAIVMFNGGAVHHVGPNRLYVTLARSLAAMGFACLRFDLEGIGDSVLQGPGRENHPYPPSATRDAHAALALLRERFGYTHFVALGLCSGAHTAFHSALQLEEDIHELILINPYAFYWKEGMSLDVVTRMADAQQYKKSMRDPSRWLKLLRGDVNMRRLLGAAMHYPKALGKSYYGALCEILVPAKASPLSRDLRSLFERKRKVTVLLAEGEPGGDIIMTEAKRTVARALRTGDMALETIEDGDHTFTLSRTRRALIERVAEHLKPCLRAQGATLR